MLLTYAVHMVHILVMTKLDAWMGDNRDDQWLAKAIGVSRSQASRIRRGKSMPSLPRAFQIEKITKGKVKAADLLTGRLAANDSAPQAEAA